METRGELSATQFKAVLSATIENEGVTIPISGAVEAQSSMTAELTVVEVVRRLGFEALGADSLAAVVAEVIAAHPDEWQRYVDGDDKVSGVFVGAVMKATKGQANGKDVVAELRRLRG
jgi:aspartyl-tRNA(Asn)/glutamyl-tRNA(Gln) amidotransferase subunit B